MCPARFVYELCERATSLNTELNMAAETSDGTINVRSQPGSPEKILTSMTRAVTVNNNLYSFKYNLHGVK